jgi:ABC-2 type transport system ATP-binding protein
LAAALIHDPEVLILDEPTSGLDPNQIIEIRQLIRDLASNKTVLFSSHILQEVESICDRVIIINKGKMVANDTIQNLRSANRNKYIVLVEFGTAVPQSAISEMDSVESVSVDEGIYHIQTIDPERLKKLLLEYSLNNNADILSLQSKSHSLEEVFRQLTGNSITQ